MYRGQIYVVVIFLVHKVNLFILVFLFSLCTQTESIDNSVTITHDATTVNLKASASIVEDTAPQLGGNLDLQSYYIYHGDVQTSIYGINVPLLNSLVQLMLTSGQLIVDLGNFLDPIDTNLDMGDITGPYVYSQNNIDFGSFELSQ